MKILRHIFPVLFIAALYSIHLTTKFGEDDYVIPLLGISLILMIINIISAVTWKGPHAGRALALWGMLLKLALIPVYLYLVLAGGLVTIGGLLFIPVIFSAIFMIITFFIFGVLLLVTTTSYSIKAAYTLGKNGALSKTAAVILSALSCFFVVDVIAAIIIFVKSSRA